MPDTFRKLQRPFERLHAAQAAAHDRGPSVDAEVIRETRLSRDPVLDGDHREIGTVTLAGVGIDRYRASRAVASAQIVHTDDEEAVRVERLARPDQVVPPTDILWIVGIGSSHVMAAGQRVANEHRIRTSGIQRTVRFVDEFEAWERRAAPQRDRLIEADALRNNDTDRIFERHTPSYLQKNKPSRP
jgi:hypothetical protein